MKHHAAVNYERNRCPSLRRPDRGGSPGLITAIRHILNIVPGGEINLSTARTPPCRLAFLKQR